MEHPDKTSRNVSASAAGSPAGFSQGTKIAGSDSRSSSDDSSVSDIRLQPVFNRAEELIDEGRIAEAQEELSQALAVFGDDANLLRRLADVDSEMDQDEAALAHMARAVASDPCNPEILSSYAELLADLGLERQALSFLSTLSSEISEHALLREVRGGLYAKADWYAFAVDAYGSSRELSRAARRSRRRCWWLSGGPIRFLRKWVRDYNDSARTTWNIYSRNLSLLDTLGRPDNLEAAMLRGQVDAYLQQWALLSDQWGIAEKLARRYSRPLIALISWLALFQVIRFIRPQVHILSAALAAIYATAIALGILLLLAVIYRATATRRNSLITMSICCVALIGGGILVASQTVAPPGWPGTIGLAMIAGAFMDISWFVTISAVQSGEYIAIKRLRWSAPRIAILDSLLDLHQEIVSVEARNNLQTRSQWIRSLEFAARTMERDLSAVFRSNDPVTDSWVLERARGAAAALRQVNRQIAVSDPNTWDRIVSVLRSDIKALASGNLAGLRWVQPCTPEPEAKRLRRMVLITLRTIGAMLLPIVVVLIIQPILKFSPNVFTWLRVGSLSWAILYFLLTIDPTLSDKIRTMSDLTTAVRGKLRSISGDLFTYT
jgi:tetratricopeptide (TPR) repeat protein